MRIAFLFTCFNRIEKTRNCICTIKDAIAYASDNGNTIEDEWFVVDAGSDDGTREMLETELTASKLHIRVERDAFYSQGMRIAMEMCKDYCLSDAAESDVSKDNINKLDYIIMINDDVCFNKEFLYKLLGVAMKAESHDSCVVVGATSDSAGRQSYGGVRYDKPVGERNSLIPRSIHYNMVNIMDNNHECHTFNANCVMIPYKAFMACDIMDKMYVHGLGDFDYGMCLYEAGNSILSTDFYVGICENNSRTGTWLDRNTSRLARIKALNSVKGSPTKQWFYYLNKHFGLATAVVHSISPYVRIIRGR